MRKNGVGMRTLRALQEVAVELKARKAPATPVQTRRINNAHREVGAMQPAKGKK